jgi:bacterioferritin-associated ferredoxin
MYICICNAIRENDLRKAALACEGDAEATYACLGKRPNCGQCLVDAQKIIDAERAAAKCDFFAVEAA